MATAIVATAFGGPEVLASTEVEVPTPGAHEVTVRIRAAAINPVDHKIFGGAFGPADPSRLPLRVGLEAAGVVTAVGEGATAAVGDEVIVYGDGAGGLYATEVTVPDTALVPKPAGLAWEPASGLLLAGGTAAHTVEATGVKEGDTVLVQGTGGVALFALQFAKLAGARVIALSSSDEKLVRAKQLGADVGINYRATPDWQVAVKDATQGKGVEIVVETAGSTMDKSLASLSFGGFIGVVGFVAGYKAEIPLRAVIGPMIRIQGIAVGSRARFEAMNRAIAQHKLKPVIDSTFPLEKAADAFRHMEQGKHFGKIVISL